MKSLRIENLKGLKDTGSIIINPITLLIGQNSYGKSSLLRSFPLFKQSSDSKIMGTVLWSGKYVDYGSFIESLNKDARNENDNEIRFTFEIETPSGLLRSNQDAKGLITIKINLHGNEYEEESYTTVIYEIYNNIIKFKFDSASNIKELIINNQDYTKITLDNYKTFKAYTILPFLFKYSDKPLNNSNSAYFNTLEKYVHHRTSNNTIRRIINDIPFSSDENIKRYLTNKNLVGEYAAPRLKNLKSTDKDFQIIKNEIIFLNLRKITETISENLTSYFVYSKYITPLRAAADRYYRIKNISIDELDPNGSNLAMFLYSKKPAEIESINNWLEESVGFKIAISPYQGHVSIHIHDETYQEKINIADTGFGISQILPILIEIWQLTHNKIRRPSIFSKSTIVVIEQPELHLHPRMQYKVGVLFCKAIRLAKLNDIDLKLILETHSKEIVDSIGKSIEDETIDHNEVGIYIVDKKQNPNVIKSKFDSDGYLVNWPYGFFNGS
ncbi:DUF3696 domain-containing protein [Comamonas sp. Y33R10-2]|uniref:AAA family ATPase n=1 Tax=Comamonas sp. Y33R10-2 TaxID=2853257 RepID=UPI001C5CBC87|nr:AAA family ATPase [Comamonas sp. Y33R10-2]QXZ11035.1 DUF3696 domain-containing protein [Comamonas sp. Y33R10-2]